MLMYILKTHTHVNLLCVNNKHYSKNIKIKV